MDIEKGEKPQKKKESNEHNPILCDTHDEEKEEFEVIKEYEDDSIWIDRL